MKRLYNEYLAQNFETTALTEPFDKQVERLFDYAQDHDIDLRDLTLVLISSITAIGGEYVLRRAMKMSKERRANPQQTPKDKP